mmetsp:Transcript_14470/g.39354  ORF Transcript_14470/g.39354 Transcript_14470/m.39354 type:complete len:354 (+) Transcript_14470:1-1062(+)
MRSTMLAAALWCGVITPPSTGQSRIVLPTTPTIARAPAPVGQMQSDSRPTAEYFDYLLGRNQKEATEDQPSTIIGDGRIGTLLAQLGERRGFDDIIIKRGDPIPADHKGPIYVCTRNDDLGAVVAQCPEKKREDLVFMQNGMLEPFRQRYGLYENTQAMLWLAVVRAGGKPIDGITSENPEGLTSVTGKWSGALAMRLGTGDLACIQMNERDYRRNALEKLIWISSFMLVGAINGGITVGEVESKHRTLVEALIRELATMTRFTLSVALKTGLEERLCAYSRKVDFFPTSLKEFKWRNGWFYRYTLLSGTTTNRNGIKIEMPDPTPLHTELLEIAQEQGLIDLGQYQDTEIQW